MCLTPYRRRFASSEVRKLVNRVTVAEETTTVTTHLADDGGVWVTTDGVRVHLDAVPGHTDEDHARAQTLGYPSVDEMTREHDYLHTLLAHASFYRDSLSLRRATSQRRMTPDQQLHIEREEALVLFVQRLLNIVRAQPGLLLDELELPDTEHEEITA